MYIIYTYISLSIYTVSAPTAPTTQGSPLRSPCRAPPLWSHGKPSCCSNTQLYPHSLQSRSHGLRSDKLSSLPHDVLGIVLCHLREGSPVIAILSQSNIVHQNTHRSYNTFVIFTIRDNTEKVSYSTLHMGQCQYSAVQCGTERYGDIPYRTVPYRAARYSTVPV